LMSDFDPLNSFGDFSNPKPTRAGFNRSQIVKEPRQITCVA
jgi:hypothetical protein